MPDKDEMSDDRFLNYCQTHSDTPRCGFVPSQIARLARLAGYQAKTIDYYESLPNQVLDMDRYAIREAVKDARTRLANTVAGDKPMTEANAAETN